MSTVFDSMRYDNSFVRDLPGDPVAENYRRQVHGACYSRVQPTAVADPKLIAFSREAAALFDLSPDQVDPDVFAQVLSGNALSDAMDPYAACYGGHQFGSWARQLGDGRAMTLGEVINQAGQRWELQLKGAGPTPYSRTADDRAVMRSSVREFLCSEAMHHLGVPTTRALSLVGTGDAVVRDMFYNGNARPEPGAIVCRVAPSFLRYGNFELLASRGETALLKTLADYAITTHFPHLGDPCPEVYTAWLSEVCETTARMVVHWMRVGFVHGVMNTDNMSLLGLTIDYGPYGWLEGYDSSWTPNTTDASGRRYCYGNQPQMAWWNLVRFAHAIHSLVGDTAKLESALDRFGEIFSPEFHTMVSGKLGIIPAQADEEPLFRELLDVLMLVETDMTIFYRRLADVPTGETATDEDLLEPLMEAYYAPESLEGGARLHTLQWLRRYTERVRADGVDPDARRAQMNAINPKYVLRNYLAQLAIDEAEKGDGSKVDALLEVMRHPYDEQPGQEAYAAKRPEWARNRPGCSMLSCSS